MTARDGFHPYHLLTMGISQNTKKIFTFTKLVRCPLTITAATLIMSLNKQHDEIFQHDQMPYIIFTNTISLIVLRSVHDLFTHFSGLFLKLATRQTKCQEKQIQTISS